MKTIKNPFDHMRLDFVCELSDAMIARVLALRVAAMAGDIDALDAAFDCVRIIGKEIAATRKEIETADSGDNRKEAA